MSPLDGEKEHGKGGLHCTGVEVNVVCYSGDRADQRPRIFHSGGSWCRILRILDHEMISGPNRGDPVVERFQVLKEGGGIVWLCREGDIWFLSEDSGR